MRSYSWPGNVRELKNIVERVIIMTSANTIGAEDVFDLVQKPAGRMVDSMPLKKARQKFEREYIVYHLQQNEWNVNKTAQELSIDRTSLYKKMRAYGIVIPAAHWD